MDRITEKDKNGKYYIVEEKICIGTEQINPIKTWITGNENRGYGKPIDKLGKLEDLMQSYSVEDLQELDKLLGMATTYEELSKQVGCPLDVIAKLRETRTCYTYTSMASSDVETLTKCDVLELDICDTLFMVGYDIDGGYVCDHELKFNEYGIKWWLEPGMLPKYRKVDE